MVARPEVTLQLQLGSSGQGGDTAETGRIRRSQLGGPRRGEKSKCKDPGAGTSWPCWRNLAAVAVAGAGEPGKIEGDTGGKSKGPGLFGVMGRNVVFVLRLLSHR